MSTEEKIFLRNVTWLRAHHGLSKKKMAKALGIGVGSLNRIERGEMPPRLGASILISIYYKFGIPPHEQFKKHLWE